MTNGPQGQAATADADLPLRRDQVVDLSSLPVRRHAVITGQDGDVQVCASVGPRGELVTVWVAAGDLSAVTARTVNRGGASFPDPDAARPVTARITVHDPALASITPVQSLGLAHIAAQPMPGGGFLIAGARCRWRPDGPDRNAIVYDAAGQVVSDHVLGDGVSHVQTTSTGQVWAGYFDEGVYGNYGWGRPDSAVPVGAPGIVQFSPGLEPAWQYPGGPPGELRNPVSECCALNVTDACVWAFCDAGSPVICIRDGVVTSWQNDLASASALAADRPCVGLFAGYGRDSGRFTLARLGEDRIHLEAEYRIVLPDGRPLLPDTHVIGRGPRLHFLTGNSWYQLEIGSIAS